MESPETYTKVSVCVLTYNHVKYVEQCLRSILAQETDFRYEVIVSDDCSTDGTADVVRKIAQESPATVRLISHARNIGPSMNYAYAHGLARGKYVAHVDGDDYLLPGKLKTQADFLDHNEWCQIVWHRMYIQRPDGQALVAQNYEDQRLSDARISVANVICSITIGGHSSKMYRAWRQSCECDIPMLDFSENVLQLSESGGQAAFLCGEPLGVYRAGIGVSRNRAYVRRIVYQWLRHFYRQELGLRRLIAAKIAWMVLSDLRHRCGSLGFGLKVLLAVCSSLSLKFLREARRQRIQVE